MLLRFAPHSFLFSLSARSRPSLLPGAVCREEARKRKEKMQALITRVKNSPLKSDARAEEPTTAEENEPVAAMSSLSVADGVADDEDAGAA